MKKSNSKRVSLKDLTVKSFVTDTNNLNAGTVRGGMFGDGQGIDETGCSGACCETF